MTTLQKSTLFTLPVVLTTLVTFVACGGSNVVGTWYEKADPTVTWTFFKDGKYTTSIGVSGTYSLEKNIIAIYFMGISTNGEVKGNQIILNLGKQKAILIKK
jgi:hypothetical protein